VQVRARFLVALTLILVVLAGGSALLTYRHRVDQRNAKDVQALAKLVTLPAGASVSTECHGDGTTACWIIQETPKNVVAEVADQLRSASTTPQVRCSTIPLMIEPTGQHESCYATVRMGSRIVSVGAHHTWARRDGKLIVVGTLVGVSAS
jgi:hypothetical protein